MQETSKTNSNESKIAVTYIRTGSIEQNHIIGGVSATRQMDKIKSVAEKQGAQLVAEFADLGVPRREKNRPAFEKLLDYLSKNKVNTVYVAGIDCLSDVTEIAAPMTHAIEKTGAQLVFTDEDRAQLKAFGV